VPAYSRADAALLRSRFQSTAPTLSLPGKEARRWNEKEKPTKAKFGAGTGLQEKDSRSCHERQPDFLNQKGAATVSKRFVGKVALVTGGSSGLGMATAKQFADEGAKVFITGRRQEELDQAVGQIGLSTAGVQGDISNMADLDRLYAVIREQSGRLDVLFANAGGGEFAPLGQITEAHVDKWLAINIKGTLFTVQKALPLMPDGASIILNGSMVSRKGIPAFGVYAATKAALRSFARTWSVDLRDRKIRVNVVAPGTVVTPAYKNQLGMTDDQIKQFEAQAAAATPLGRAGTPDEIAKAVLFLASDDSSFVTGIELFVDGGAAQI
jgi:NAD(P)-dependent dehydrogenase (short-subunit alcohol dehydrogenase family)